MQKIKIYTKGLHTYIKEIDSNLIQQDFKSDGYNIHFENCSVTLEDSLVVTMITTASNNESNGETIYYTIDDSDNLLRPANPLISGGEYFKNVTNFEDNSGVIVGNIKDWKDPISTIELDIDEPIDPQKLYFCVISLRPFFKELGIMGVVYADLSDEQKEQLYSGEFYDPNSIEQLFDGVKVASVEYDMEIQKWYFELYAGKIFNNNGQYSFRKTSQTVQVDFDEYQKAIAPKDEDIKDI